MNEMCYMEVILLLEADLSITLPAPKSVICLREFGWRFIQKEYVADLLCCGTLSLGLADFGLKYTQSLDGKGENNHCITACIDACIDACIEARK